MKELKNKSIKELVDEYNKVMLDYTIKLGWSEYYKKNYDGTFTLTKIL